MRTRAGAAALAAAALLALGAAALSPAAATTMTWTVKPGGAVAGKAGMTTLRDTTTDTLLNCKSATMTGTLKAGSGLPGAGIGAITAAAISCPSPTFGFKLAARGLPWRLSLSGYDRRTGVARGTISHLELAFSGPGCSAVINGTGGATADGVVAVSYADKTGKLTILQAGGNLHWYHVKGCAGLVADADNATLTTAYTLSPPQFITSP